MDKAPLSYNKQIDGLRCFAVLGVLIFHFIRFDNAIVARFPFGQGVNLFFVISGYLITQILLVNKESIQQQKTTTGKVLRSFYLRRTLRIFPIYYLTIFYLLAINFQNIKSVWVWLVTYTTNFYISNDQNPYIGSFNHLWSLAVEEQFYLFWPFLILAVPKKYIETMIVGIIVLSLTFKITYFNLLGYSTAINAHTLSCLDSLGFGALIAYWNLYRKPLIQKIAGLNFIVLISFIPFFFFLIYPRDYEALALVGNNFLFSVFAFFVVMKASQTKFSFGAKFLLDNKLSLHIGKISYGIYLYHFFMPDLYNQMIDWFPGIFTAAGAIRIPFYFLAAILLAECSWFLIERPMMMLKKRFQYD